MATANEPKNKKFFRKLNAQDKDFISAAVSAKKFPVITRQEVLNLCSVKKLAVPYWLMNDPQNRVDKATYYIPDMNGCINMEEITKLRSLANDGVGAEEEELYLPSSNNIGNRSEYTPAINMDYIGWGANYKKLQTIVGTGTFMPVYITGLSGNGKTTMVEQICANNNRDFIRVNINELTDEDDLIGGMRLVDGNTVWQDGPVTIAAKIGAILLLDEIDLASMKIMCLQPVLEGKPFFIKKINQWVYPTKGFNVVATGNTKGLGDDTGGFIGTNFLNEAMMDRFDLTFQQGYPSPFVEKKILTLKFENSQETPNIPFIDALVAWANDNRKTYEQAGISKVITTRRLIAIIKHFMVFGDMKMAVLDTIERFDVATRDALAQLFDKYIPKPEIPDIGAKTTKKKSGEIDYENDTFHEFCEKLGFPKEQFEKLPNDI